MQKISKKFQDFILRHQHYLQRVENGTIQQMIRPYERAKKEIGDRLIDFQKTVAGIPEGPTARQQFQIQRLNAQLAEIEGTLKTAAHDAAGTLHQTLAEIAGVENGTYAKMLSDEFGRIGINIVGLPHAQIDFILQNPLIYQYRRMTPTDTLLWNNQEFISTIRTELTQAIIQGEDMATATKRLIDVDKVRMGTYAEKKLVERAAIIAQSEIQNVSNSVARGIYAANQDVLKGVSWSSTLDRRTCLHCAALDGKYFPFEGGGKDHSGPLNPLHCYCRCCYIPVTKSWEELEKENKIAPEIPDDVKRAFDGGMAEQLTYDQWFRQQPVEFQKEFLGKRFRYWESGELKLGEMIKDGKIMSVEDLKRLVRKIKKPIKAEKPMSSIGDLANCIIRSRIEMQIFEKESPDPCIDYTRSGKKWFLQGHEIINEQTLARLNGMGLPPAWKEVVVSVDPAKKVQAIGMDKAGRWQYRYSAEHVDEAARKKFNRLESFRESMPAIRKEIEKGIAKDDPRAYLLKIEDKTAIRIGSDTDFKAKVKAYGLTTLKHEHVLIEGDRLFLDFVAKEGIPARYEIADDGLKRWLLSRKTSSRIRDNLFPDVSAKRLNDYLREISGGDYTVKDFRTYHGTRIAHQELKDYAGRSLTKKERQEVVKNTLEKVSKFLSNTPAMARKAYIDPIVWDFIGGI